VPAVSPEEIDSALSEDRADDDERIRGGQVRPRRAREVEG
jgi:hypothetical protein